MKLPRDPVMLLSVVNTALRDKYNSFEDLENTEDIDGAKVISSLALIGYEYKKELNQFV